MIIEGLFSLNTLFNNFGKHDHKVKYGELHFCVSASSFFDSEVNLIVRSRVKWPQAVPMKMERKRNRRLVTHNRVTKAVTDWLKRDFPLTLITFDSNYTISNLCRYCDSWVMLQIASKWNSTWNETNLKNYHTWTFKLLFKLCALCYTDVYCKTID